MPQQSVLYSAARVRTLEKTLINNEDMKRIAEAPDLNSAFKLLNEHGYSAQSQDDENADVLNEMLSAQIRSARELLSELTTNESITNVFLLRPDIGNLKLLIKSRVQNLDLNSVVLDENALVSPLLMRSMVKAWEFFGLPRQILVALEALGRQLWNMPKSPQRTENPDYTPQDRFNPAIISTMLDQAYYAYARSLGNPFLNEYFSAECDFINLSALFRIKKQGGTERDFLAAMAPMGVIPTATFLKAFACEEPDPLKWTILDGIPARSVHLRYVLDKRLGEVINGTPERLERIRDNYLMDLTRQGRKDMETILPVIAFYLARLRETECVRMIITLKRNGCSPAFIKERLRETYV